MIDLVGDLRQLADDIVTNEDVARAVKGRHPDVLRAAANEIVRFRAMFEELAKCDLNGGNCSSVEIAASRVRSIARFALGNEKESFDAQAPS